MPYKNIVFVKLEKRLLDDPRWYALDEKVQLNYIKLILNAAQTWNKVPKNVKLLKKAFKTNQHLSTIEKSLKDIKKNFPKFKETNDFYYFEDFNEKTNYIPEREILGKSLVSPKEVVDKDIDKDIDKEQPSAVKTALDKVYQQGLNIYSLINKIKKELGWAAGRNFPDEVILGVCQAYEKDKANIKEDWAWFAKVIKQESANYFANQNVKEGEKHKKEVFNLKDILKGA